VEHLPRFRIPSPRDRRKGATRPPTWWPPPLRQGPAPVGDYETLPLYDIEVWQVSEYDCMRAPSFLRGNSYRGPHYGNESCRRAPYYERSAVRQFRLVPPREEVTSEGQSGVRGDYSHED